MVVCLFLSLYNVYFSQKKVLYDILEAQRRSGHSFLWMLMTSITKSVGGVLNDSFVIYGCLHPHPLTSKGRCLVSNHNSFLYAYYAWKCRVVCGLELERTGSLKILLWSFKLGEITCYPVSKREITCLPCHLVNLSCPRQNSTLQISLTWLRDVL